MNKVILIGRLAVDPSVHITQTEKTVTTFDLAVKKYEGSKDVDFHSIVVWGKKAEDAGNNLGKGRLICVDGRLNKRSYEAKDGTKKVITEIVANHIHYLDKKASAANQDNQITVDSLGTDVSPEEMSEVENFLNNVKNMESSK